jgi:hypothetical protein
MDPGPFFYIDNTIYYKHCYFLQTNISFHTIRLILYFQQNQWDWQPHCKLGQSILVVLFAGSTLLTDDGSASCQKSASSNLQKCFLSPTGRLNFGFILRENLVLCSSYHPLGVSQWILWDISRRSPLATSRLQPLPASPPLQISRSAPWWPEAAWVSHG